MHLGGRQRAGAKVLGWDPMTRDESQEYDEDLPLRWWVIAAFMTVAIGGFVVAVLLSVLWYSTCDDHDPG